MSSIPVADVLSGDFSPISDELMLMIMEEFASLCRRDKNEFLSLRLVCKRFSNLAVTIAFATVSLDAERLFALRGSRAVEIRYLGLIAPHIRAIHLDLGSIRIPEEIRQLETLVEDRPGDNQHYLGLLAEQDTFVGRTNHPAALDDLLPPILDHTERLHTIMVSLPEPMLRDGYPSRLATLALRLLTRELQARNASRPLRTLVINALVDVVLPGICDDFEVYSAFAASVATVVNLGVHLIRTSRSTSRLGAAAGQTLMDRQIWQILGCARNLENIEIRGDGSGPYGEDSEMDETYWRAQRFSSTGMPMFEPDTLRPHTTWDRLEVLTLVQLNIFGADLIQILTLASPNLKILHLCRVGLKWDAIATPQQTPSLWIGHGDAVPTPIGDIWVADQIRALILNGTLKALERVFARGLCYDYVNRRNGSVVSYTGPGNFDMEDVNANSPSFDRRFEIRALGFDPRDPSLPVIRSNNSSPAVCGPPGPRSLDGYFPPSNPTIFKHLKELVSLAP